MMYYKCCCHLNNSACFAEHMISRAAHACTRRFVYSCSSLPAPWSVSVAARVPTNGLSEGEWELGGGEVALSEIHQRERGEAWAAAWKVIL